MDEEYIPGKDERRNRTWEVEKKIPISVIVILVFQTLGFTWAAATMSTNVKNNSVNIIETRSLIKELRSETKDLADKVYFVRDAERDSADIQEIKQQLREHEKKLTDLHIEVERLKGD